MNFTSISASAAAGGDPQRTALADGKFPSLAAAFQIRRGRLRDLRPMLEAYLVTDVKEETLAAKLALPPETIPAYRLAFFDLQTLGKAPLPVIFRVIGIGGAATSNLDQCGLLKLIGLKLGAAGLDAYFFGTQGNDTAFKSGDLGAWLSHACRIEAAAKLMITISNLHPDDSKTLPALLDLQRRWSQDERKSDRDPTQLKAHIHAMLLELPWLHGKVAKEAFADTTLGKCDELAAELRDDELQLVGSGEQVPVLDDLANIRFGRETAPSDEPFSAMDPAVPGDPTPPGPPARAATAPPAGNPAPPSKTPPAAKPRPASKTPPASSPPPAGNPAPPSKTPPAAKPGPASKTPPAAKPGPTPKK